MRERDTREKVETILSKQMATKRGWVMQGSELGNQIKVYESRQGLSCGTRNTLCAYKGVRTWGINRKNELYLKRWVVLAKNAKLLKCRMSYTNVVCQKYLDSILIQKKSSVIRPLHLTYLSTLCLDVVIIQTIGRRGVDAVLAAIH